MNKLQKLLKSQNINIIALILLIIGSASTLVVKYLVDGYLHNIRFNLLLMSIALGSMFLIDLGNKVAFNKQSSFGVKELKVIMTLTFYSLLTLLFLSLIQSSDSFVIIFTNYLIIAILLLLEVSITNKLIINAAYVSFVVFIQGSISWLLLLTPILIDLISNYLTVFFNKAKKDNVQSYNTKEIVRNNKANRSSKKKSNIKSKKKLKK